MSKLTLKKQGQIIQTCIRQERDLSEELERLGLTYDDLRYKTYPKDSNGKNGYSDYSTISDFNFSRTGIPFVSFFTGAGGMDLGFEAAGFSHLLAIENDKTFCETLRFNKPKWDVIGPPTHSGDVRKREELALLLKKKGVQKGFDGLFIGGPPCQPFSIASNQRYRKGEERFKRNGFRDKDRGNLLFDFIWFVQQFKPKIFVIENVPGLLAVDNGNQLKLAIEKLELAGYKVNGPFLTKASDFGVPQNRTRVFIVGWRTSGDFVFSPNGLGRVPVAYALKSPVSSLANHITRKHKAESIARYMELGIGQRDSLGRVDRLDPYAPAKTVIAGGTQGGGRSHLHPKIPRTLSVRESARLQTFPDDYVFCGIPGRQFTQVGNAVPPLLAMKLARQIVKQLLSR